ncbi:aldo/keto reductase, partial [Pseudoalteromonas sp. SIMBA_162]
MATNRRMAEVIADMANQKGCTAAQLSLAWLLSKGTDIVPIPGTKQQRYLMENAAATTFTLT